MPYKDKIKSNQYHSKYLREWQKKNREKSNAYSLKWYHENKEKFKEKRKKYNKEYCIKNKEKILEKNKKWRGKNREWLRNKAREKGRRSIINSGKKWFRGLNKRVYPNQCELCNKKQKRGLHYHHWDDTNPSMGMWICIRCHILAEHYEQRKITTIDYLELKEKIKKGGAPNG